MLTHVSWAGWEWEIVQTSTESAKGEVRETTVGHPLRDSSDHGCHCDTSTAAGTAPFPPVLGRFSREVLQPFQGLCEAGALHVEDDLGLTAGKVSKPPFGHASFATVASPPGFPLWLLTHPGMWKV